MCWDGGAAEIEESELVPEDTLGAVVAELLPELELDGCAVAEDPRSDIIESPITT